MNTLTKLAAVVVIGCVAGGAISSLAVAQVAKGLPTMVFPFNCTLSYKGGSLVSPVTVQASNSEQAEQMAMVAATPTGASCKMRENQQTD
ncbi:hypothetical protein [Stenotrophomonas sp. PD6]|uniref:hypothetical protein n=1 Tax=Stenotrophomonas sp. PD6 TaxID=3368612 RepID=UPI003B9FA333